MRKESYDKSKAKGFYLHNKKIYLSVSNRKMKPYVKET